MFTRTTTLARTRTAHFVNLQPGTTGEAPLEADLRVGDQLWRIYKAQYYIRIGLRQRRQENITCFLPDSAF